jgi:hypothetical protein
MNQQHPSDQGLYRFHHRIEMELKDINELKNENGIQQ